MRESLRASHTTMCDFPEPATPSIRMRGLREMDSIIICCISVASWKQFS